MASSSLSGLFRGGAGAWTFAPGITLPIFDAGRNSANLRFTKAERDAATARYEQAVQAAFRDVADALADRAGTARPTRGPAGPGRGFSQCPQVVDRAL